VHRSRVRDAIKASQISAESMLGQKHYFQYLNELWRLILNFNELIILFLFWKSFFELEDNAY